MLNNNQDVVIKIKQNTGKVVKGSVVDKNESQYNTILFFIAGWYDSQGVKIDKKP